MTAARKKTAPTKAAGTGRWKTGSKILLAALVIAVTIVLATERQQWPEAVREHQAAKTVYSLRDKAVTEARSLFAPAHKPLDITAKKKQAPEQGYSAKDRDSLENLLREEGVAKP